MSIKLIKTSCGIEKYKTDFENYGFQKNVNQDPI